MSAPDEVVERAEQYGAELTSDLDRTVRRYVLAALESAPQVCRFHGADFEFLGMQWGEPRCESCRQPWRVVRALDALKGATPRRRRFASPGGPRRLADEEGT